MILSIDHGFGEDKVAQRIQHNSDTPSLSDFKLDKTNSALAEAPLEADDMPLFEGRRYYIGDIALMEDSSAIKNILDYKDHETIVPLSTWNVFNELNIKYEDIDRLAIGLSLAQKQYAKEFISRLSKFKVNGKIYDFKNRIDLVPQGVGAKYAIDYLYYKKGDTPNYVLIDPGLFSVEVATVINGKVRKEQANGTGHDGVIKIINEIQEHITEVFGEVISIKEAQEVLKTNIYIYNEEHDLTEVINKFRINYTNYLSSKLKVTYKNLFKKYQTFYLVGGGSYYIDKDLFAKINNKPSEAIVIPEYAEFFNAIGYLIVSENALLELNKQKED